MRAKTLQILWHEREPVFAVDFEPVAGGRLATCGGDKCARIWRVIQQEDQPPSMEFLSTLSRHTAAVNCVRWSPNGGLLASGGDDGSVLIWQQTESKLDMALEDDDGSKENWRVTAVLRGSSSDMYDLAWSPDGRYILAACIDNSCRIYDTKENKCVNVITDHQHFVQGVSWDPLNKFIATQSSDRCMNVYNVVSAKQGGIAFKVAARHSRLDRSRLARKEIGASDAVVVEGDCNEETFKQIVGTPSKNKQSMQSSPACKTPLQSRIANFENKSPATHLSQMTASQSPLKPASISTSQQTSNDDKTNQAKTIRLFSDENLASFFRRLAFSPDGSLLVAPAGIAPKENNSASSLNASTTNTVYIYSRGRLASDSIMHLPGHRTAAVAIRFNPNRYELLEPLEDRTIKNMIQLPYRFVYAVATQDAVIVYDTQHGRPIAYFGRIHYATYTDVAWSHDGRMLIMSSTDGFCSMVEFDDGELGRVCEIVAEQPVVDAMEISGSAEVVNFVAEKNLSETATKTDDVDMTVLQASAIDSTQPTNVESEKTISIPAIDQVDPIDPSAVDATSPAPKKRRIAPIFLGSAAPISSKTN